MKPAILPPSMVSVSRIFGTLILCLLAGWLIGRPALRSWQERESVKVQKQHEWIRNVVRELDDVEPPPSDVDLSSSQHPWITPKHLVFSNGWAAYRIHTVHSSPLIGDIALLRLADGRVFSSKLHYCVGINEMMSRPDGELRRPADAQDFFSNCGKRQQWNLISQDGRVHCAIICPDADHPSKNKKALWLLLGTSDNSIGTNLFERRYVFSGNNIAWTTRWNSNNDLTVEVFNFARNPMTHSPGDPEPSTDPLATLKINRDKQTGRFIDEQP